MADKGYALITGGNKGIGWAISQRFATAGYGLVIISRSGLAADKQNWLAENTVMYLEFKGDVADEAFVKATVQSLKAQALKLAVLVNNAGVTKDGLFLRMKPADFDAVIDTNLKGAVYFSQHVGKLMCKQRAGAIINISSVVAERGNIGQANYVTSKAALLGLTKATAQEYGLRGVTVNVVAPGFIQTEMTAKLPEKNRIEIEKQIPLQKLGTPEDVSEAVYFLSQQKYITGTTLDVNGGLYMN